LHEKVEEAKKMRLGQVEKARVRKKKKGAPVVREPLLLITDGA
jgi:hypothetical protein